MDNETTTNPRVTYVKNMVEHMREEKKEQDSTERESKYYFKIQEDGTTVIGKVEPDRDLGGSISYNSIIKCSRIIDEIPNHFPVISTKREHHQGGILCIEIKCLYSEQAQYVVDYINSKLNGTWKLYKEPKEELKGETKEEALSRLKREVEAIEGMKEEPEELIDSPEKFKNCYIDLSNTELNGEITEERFERLAKCLDTIGFIVKHRDRFNVKGSIDCNLIDSKERYIWNSNVLKYPAKEVSVHDIKGYDEEPKQEPKNIYTLEEFKTQNIAINTRTQEEYDSLMDFFDSVGITWCDEDGVKAYNGFKYYLQANCMKFYKNENLYGLQHAPVDFYERSGYTVTNPLQLKEYNDWKANNQAKVKTDNKYGKLEVSVELTKGE